MKKLIVLVLLSGVLGGVAFAENIERGFVNVSANATAELTPDVVEFSVAVQTFDNKSLQKATLQNRLISETVINNLKSMINSADGDYVKTSNYNATPVYVYSNNKRSIDKYQVSNTVIVHTKSIDKVGEMIDKAIASGATNVNSLNFSVSNYENQCNDLINTASDKAKQTAFSAVKNFPANVVGIRTMDVSCSANNSYRPRLLKSNAMMDSAAEVSSTTIEKGIVKIYANVNASYFVK